MRPKRPGDIRWRGGLQNEVKFLNRTYVAQVTEVNPETGVLKVRPVGTRQEFDATVPLYGLSIQGFRSSWMRYMPQRQDFVKVCFGPLNQCEVVSMATFGEEVDPTSTEGRSGSRIPFVGGYATIQKKANNALDGLSDFAQLKPGEWDMRSAGGAYIRGRDNGTLTLTGGAIVRFDLSKNRDEICSRAKLNILGGDGSDLRIGTVKRLVPGVDLLPSEATFSHPGGVDKEYRAIVGTTLPTGTTASLFESRAGHLVDDTGVAPDTQGGTQLPLRSRVRWFDDTPTTPQQTLSVEVDNLGNVRVVQADLAVPGGVEIVGGAASPLSVSFLNIDITANAQSGTANLSGQFVNLNAGGTADTPIPRGNELKAYLDGFSQAFDAHTHATSMGPSGPASTAGVGPLPATALSTNAMVK